MIRWDKQQIVGCGLKAKKRKEVPIVVANIVIPVLQDLCEWSKTDKLLDMRRDAFYTESHVILARFTPAVTQPPPLWLSEISPRR
jgi:hypothetical protein